MKSLTKAIPDTKVSERELRNRNIAYNAAFEGIVLLKNDNNALPIKAGNIALYGAGAKLTIKGGTGSGEVNERYSVNIYDGLINRGFKVTTDAWINDLMKDYEGVLAEYKERTKFNIFKMKDLINIMGQPIHFPFGREISDEDVKNSNTDTAIYVVSRQAGEGLDKRLSSGDFDLQEIEINHLKKLVASYKNVVLVINSGSSMNVKVADDIGVNSIIYFSMQGCEGGNAFADIILGNVCPSGKLTDTWAKEYSDIPFSNEYSYLKGNVNVGQRNDELYKEDIYVGYRFFDSFKVDPKFCFGFGLSYSKFDIEPIDASYSNGTFTMSVKVTNEGNYDGKEVVQIYCSCPRGKLVKEYQRLVAFKKTSLLKPGTSEVLSITFLIRDIASYSEEDSSFIVEKGSYKFRIGNSSRSTKLSFVGSLDKDIIYSKNKNIVSKDSRVGDYKHSNVFEDSETDYKEFIIDSDFETITYDYVGLKKIEDEKVNKILETLSVKEMIDICVGDGFSGIKSTSGLYTPGAVGRTTPRLVKKGLINVNLADGPAGLRLLKRSARKKNGKILLYDDLFSFMSGMPKLFKMFNYGNEKRDTILYQFTTAFPVAISLAQTWNEDLLYEVGRAVSEEMDEYMCTYWLAPALNIHRNPLCGRNFEYFSEDPLLAGKVTAGITKGVQSISGNYVTIKHFACNNQEDNRNNSNSVVSERALREIYIKGFEIAVTESDPKSLMTSYNLINGTYTANQKGLLTDVLRNEWGFSGVVMTDWFSTGNGLANNATAIKVGNDMIMPGTKHDRKEITAAINDGSLSVDELKIATANIIYSILYSNVAKEFKPSMLE
ncbi:MAG: glycoside hydrolase family 3 C-terminal domain-containing protein [Clostridia bacterium]|nr:glycoside hydrolase family 3 C-terminal domain-containing protein [Clostridia bacterium]